MNLPNDKLYETLKTELIKRTTASEQRKLQQLISGEELGDRKPTQLLRRMQQLLGDKLGSSADTNTFLRELFLQRLPTNVRMVLAFMYGAVDVSKLADMADKVMEVAAPTIGSMTEPTFECLEACEVRKLREDVARLSNLVASMRTRPQGRSRSKSRRANSPAPSTTAYPESFCWYHAKYGNKAEKCREPCSWENDQAGR